MYPSAEKKQSKKITYFGFNTYKLTLMIVKKKVFLFALLVDQKLS